MGFFKRRRVTEIDSHVDRRSAVQTYLDGGGDPADERTMAILAEADRSAPGVLETSLHAHEVTSNDAALIRMMAGANFGPDATVTLPSGRTITGAEMQRWVNSERNEHHGHH